MSGVPIGSGLSGAALELRLDMADGVVAEAADEPAGEARQPGQRRGAVAREILSHELERIGRVGLLRDALAVDDEHLVPADDDPRLRRQADERVAAEAFAALHGFEEIRVRPGGELEVDRERRVEVGEGLEHQRHPVEAFGG